MQKIFDVNFILDGSVVSDSFYKLFLYIGKKSLCQT